jgi:hypothetical protein
MDYLTVLLTVCSDLSKSQADLSHATAIAEEPEPITPIAAIPEEGPIVAETVSKGKETENETNSTGQEGDRAVGMYQAFPTG